MIKLTHTQLILTLTLGCTFQSFTANATLIDLGNGAVYDNTENVSWTQNLRYDEIDLYSRNGGIGGLWGLSIVNLGGTQHTVTETDIYQINPPLVGGTWWGATGYASTLTFAGVGGWRLPTGPELLGVLGNSQFSSGVFTRTGDVRGQYLMWTNTETTDMTAILVDFLNPSKFYASSIAKGTPSSGGVFVAWAVHDGNISAVPETNSALLSLIALLLTTIVASRSKIKGKRLFLQRHKAGTGVRSC